MSSTATLGELGRLLVRDLGGAHDLLERFGHGRAGGRAAAGLAGGFFLLIDVVS
jgi:hypothetical protein